MSAKIKQEYQILHDDEIDIKALWMVLWTNKFALAKIVSGFFLLGIIYIIFATRLYYSNSTIIPSEADASSSMSSMLSLASSVGMSVSQPSEAPTVNIIDFALSRRLRDDILGKIWIDKKGKEIDLISLWEISDTTGIINAIKSGIKLILHSEPNTEEETRLKWFEDGRDVLEERVIALPNENGLILVEVWMEDPLIAKNMTRYVIESMVEYTKRLKADQGKKDREFLVQRMNDVKIELQQAEDKMTEFQKDNRRVIDSPELLIELANLKRDVEIKTQLYITLQNEYEFARLEEAKDSSGLIILDDANYPIEPDVPKIILVIIISIMMGSILSIPIFLIYRAVRH